MHFPSYQSVKALESRKLNLRVSVCVFAFVCVCVCVWACMHSEMHGCVHTCLRNIHNNNIEQHACACIHACCVHVYVCMCVRAAAHMYLWAHVGVCGVMTESVRVLAVSLRENTQLGRVTLD